VRNVQANPRVVVRTGGEAFAGVVEQLHDRADERHVMDLVGPIAELLDDAGEGLSTGAHDDPRIDLHVAHPLPRRLGG